MPKLTKRIVDTLKPDPAGPDLFVWDAGDGALKGFGVRLKPSGTASYIVQYRNKEGRTRRMVIGKVGVLTPDEARTLASDKLREATKGGDPSADRHAARKSMTVSDLCDWYLKEAAAWVKASTLDGDKSRIEIHVKPLLGRRSVIGLTLTEIEKFQAEIAAGKTAKARPANGRAGKASGGRGVAARTVGMLGTILEFARRNQIIQTNPARGVRKYPDEKRRRFLSIDELKALGEAMRKLELLGGNKTALAAIRLLLLTGCRRNEVLTLPWIWVDQKSQCIRFGDTKSGAQLRPIGKTAMAQLQLQPKTSAYAFPGTGKSDDKGGHFVGLPRILDRVCELAGLEDVTIHTLRHTFAATAAELGFTELTIAGLLGHTLRGITARYAHVPDSALIVAADRISSRILLALEGKASADIVNI